MRPLVGRSSRASESARRVRAASIVVFAALLALPATVAARKRGGGLPCPEGRFEVLGSALMNAAGSDDAIVIAGGGLAVSSGCGPAVVAVRRTKSKPGHVLRARWRRCLAGGAVRMQASFTADCEELRGTVMKPKKQRLAFRARRHRPGDRPPGGGPGPHPGPSPGPGPGPGPAPGPDPVPGPDPTPGPDPVPGPGAELGTFGVIARRIFAGRGCNVDACHGAALSGGLDLRSGAAYANLVGVAATGAPGARRVVAGRAADSFLSRKLRGQLAPSEGARMPLNGDQLSVLERDLVDIWINGGAPETADVPGAPVLPVEGYLPAEPPPVPPGGIQLVLDGPFLEPGRETEGCLWVPAPNATNLAIARTSVVANPGTHHVVVWRHTAGGTPPLNTWRAGDIACLSSGAQLGTTGLAGAGMGNGSNSPLPPGVASVLPGGGYFGLNAHYYNEFDVPIQVKVWFNFYPYEGTPAHYVEGITSLDTTYGISVPPFTQEIRRGRFQNNGPRTLHVLALGGHMHKRGLRFSAWFADGTKIFDDYNWAHPVGRAFAPPFDLAPGQWIDYECLHDNGVTRPVRLNAQNRPTTLTFGISAEDEMCILTGSFYTD